MISASRLALAAAAGIAAALFACQDGPSPQTPNGVDGDGGTTSSAKEPTAREPSEKHSCGDHGH
jgi:hypothetical protein